MSIIGGILGGFLSSLGALTQSFGTSVGLALQQVIVAGADIINNTQAVAAGGLQNLTAGLTAGLPPADLVGNTGDSTGGLSLVWLDPNTLGM